MKKIQQLYQLNRSKNLLLLMGVLIILSRIIYIRGNYISLPIYELPIYFFVSIVILYYATKTLFKDEDLELTTKQLFLSHFVLAIIFISISLFTFIIVFDWTYLSYLGIEVEDVGIFVSNVYYIILLSLIIIFTVLNFRNRLKRDILSINIHILGLIFLVVGYLNCQTFVSVNYLEFSTLLIGNNIIYVECIASIFTYMIWKKKTNSKKL
jgi:hypothetical protein